MIAQQVPLQALTPEKILCSFHYIIFLGARLLQNSTA
jgi:hypothetical protein